MNKWKQLLADKSIANDVQVTINGQNFTVGELRNAEVESEGQLSAKLQAREEEINKQAKLQETALENFAKILTNVEKVSGISMDKLISGDVSTAQRTQQTTQADDIWARDEFKPLKSKFDPLEAQVKQVVQLVSTLAKHYMNDQARRDFSAYKVPEGATGITLEKALQHAMANRYVDDAGIPNVTKALDDMTAPLRAKKSEEEIRADEREKARKEFEMAQFSQPTNGGAGGIQFDSSPAKGNSSEIPSIASQLDKAFKDQSIIQTLRTQ